MIQYALNEANGERVIDGDRGGIKIMLQIYDGDLEESYLSMKEGVEGELQSLYDGG